jgi:putative addiction module component (TIGR02574 family)
MTAQDAHSSHALAPIKSRCSVRIVSESLKKFGLDKLSVEQRLALIEEIWSSIDADESAAMQLTDAQHAELRTRLTEDDAAPDDIVSWDEIKRLAPAAGGK